MRPFASRPVEVVELPNENGWKVKLTQDSERHLLYVLLA